MPERRPGGHTRGFSLIELLVAFTILGLLLGALAQVFGDGLRAVDRSDRRARAMLIAQSQLARVGVDAPLRGGAERGDTNDGFAWIVRVERTDEFDPKMGRRVVTPYRVRVEVTDERDRAAGRIVLESLRLDSEGES